MREKGSIINEASAIEDDLYRISIALRAAPIGGALEKILAQQSDMTVIKRLELRKKETVPLPTSVVLLRNPEIETIHPYSRTPFLLKISRKSRGREDYDIKSNLRRLRKRGVAEDSMQTHDLLKPFTDSDEDSSKFLIRTAEEIAEIEAIRESIPPGTEVEKRKYLRELGDKLIIDRFISAAVNKTIPLYSNVHVDKSGKFVFVSYYYHGKINKQFVIENPDWEKYDSGRNEKLSILLAKLRLA